MFCRFNIQFNQNGNWLTLSRKVPAWIFQQTFASRKNTNSDHEAEFERLWHQHLSDHKINPATGDILNRRGTKLLKQKITPNTNMKKVSIKGCQYDVGTLNWEHCNQQQLHRHSRIVYKNGNTLDTSKDNLGSRYRVAFLNQSGKLVLPQVPIDDLEGYECADKYPDLLVNAEKGLVIDKESRLLKGNIKWDGYVVVKAKDKDGNVQHVMRSRLVWEHVHGKIKKRHQIDHLDHTDRSNDSIHNLQQLSIQRNAKKSCEQSGRKFYERTPVIANELLPDGMLGEDQKFDSMRQAADHVEVCVAHISKICRYAIHKTAKSKTGRVFTFRLQ